MAEIMKKHRADIEASVEAVLNVIEQDKVRETVSVLEYPLIRIRKHFEDFIAEEFGLSANEFSIKLEIPPSHVHADLTFSVFPLAKNTRKSPKDIADIIVAKISKSEFVDSIEAVNGYLNIHLNKQAFYAGIMLSTNKLGTRYGETDANAGKVVLIDYSSPNIAKPIGIGHLRSTVIGQALGNIYRATGYTVVRDNHLGDWGTQFGSLIYAYQEWGDENKISANPIEELKNLYVKFTAEAEKNPELKEKAKEIFSKLEKGDQELLALWKKFYDMSLEEFNKTYDRLGVKFDLNIGESYFLNEADSITEEMLEKDIAKVADDGAVAVEIDGLPSFLLRKNDGASLYITRDLATLRFRVKKFDPEAILYIVGSEQELNFRQLFALAAKWGFDTKKLFHISFGLVLKDGKKMSTRKGTLVNLEDVLNESVSKSAQLLEAKNKSLTKTEIEEISNIVGVGAILYNDLGQSRTKNIEFDWDRMLNYETGSAVYLQYTYVRIQSILEKAGIKPEFAENVTFQKDIEFELARKVSIFPEIILQSKQFNETYQISAYLEELASLFNSFYAAVPVISAETPELLKSRLLLISAVASVIKKGLQILNIGMPSKL